MNFLEDVVEIVKLLVSIIFGLSVILVFLLLSYAIAIDMGLADWECSARDVRDNSCVEYSLKKLPPVEHVK